MGPEQLFVVPDLHGRPTGGTLYNRRLLAALGELGHAVRACRPDQLEAALGARRLALIWLDSLYLEHAPATKVVLAGRAQLGLLLHYLPSLVAFGRRVTVAELGAVERAALSVADCALVPSEFMRRVLHDLGFGPRPVLSVEPGCELSSSAMLPNPTEGVRALLVGHVVSGKGIEPLLSALASALAPSDPFELRIIGDTSAEPAYAQRCRALVATEPALTERVRFSGALSPADAEAALFSSNLMLSASLMESYGMALAEARRAGLPLLARDAGNVAFHVDAEAGGELVSDPVALATACARLSRAPAEHARRLLAAQAHRLPARPWRHVAEQQALSAQEMLRSFAACERS